MFTCRPISALITSILSTAALLKLCHNKTLLMQEYTHTRWKLRVCLTLKKQDIFEFMECFATQQFLKPWNESLTILKSRIRTEKTNVITVLEVLDFPTALDSCVPPLVPRDGKLRATALCFIRQLVTFRISERHKRQRSNESDYETPVTWASNRINRLTPA